MDGGVHVPTGEGVAEQVHVKSATRLRLRLAREQGIEVGHATVGPAGRQIVRRPMCVTWHITAAPWA